MKIERGYISEATIDLEVGDSIVDSRISDSIISGVKGGEIRGCIMTNTVIYTRQGQIGSFDRSKMGKG